jgi:hypothetical protein
VALLAVGQSDPDQLFGVDSCGVVFGHRTKSGGRGGGRGHDKGLGGGSGGEGQRSAAIIQVWP